MKTPKATNSWNKNIKTANDAIPLAIDLCNHYFGSTSFHQSTFKEDLLGSDINAGGIHIDIKVNDYSSRNFVCEWGNEYKIGWTVDTSKITNNLLWICTDAIILMDYKPIRDMCIRDEKQILVNRGWQWVWSENETTGQKWKVKISLIKMTEMKEFILKRWEK